jgi:hypothetical protein
MPPLMRFLRLRTPPKTLLQSRPKKWYSVWQPFTNIDSFGHSKDIWPKGPSMSNNLRNFTCHHNHKEIDFLYYQQPSYYRSKYLEF